MGLKFYFLVALVLMTSLRGLSQAIYSGGDAAGFGVSCFTQTEPNIYGGGNDAGFGVSCFTQTEPSIYGGGTDDGFGVSCFTQTEPSIYGGGTDDGFGVSCFTQTEPSIYSGGMDDGFGVSCFTQTEPSIYGGGTDDGFGVSCFSQTEPGIYGGGTDDGFGVNCFSQTEPGIYGGGTDDGFGVSCFTQTEPSIYGGGTDDGFGVSCFTQTEPDIYGGGTDDGFGGACSSTPLPITLIDFNAFVRDNWVYIEWQTTREINSDYFTVEKSKIYDNWVEVGQVQGAGNSDVTLNYNALDKTPYKGISYYRLKQTDFDGDYQYSEIVAVNVKIPMTEVVIYPNPATSQITIQANQQELSTIKIYNILGQEVTNKTQQRSISVNNIVIDLSNLASGLYIVKTKSTANNVYKE